jgi:hypothetical protein
VLSLLCSIIDTMAVRKRFVNPFARRESEKSATDSHDIETHDDSKPPFEKPQETDQSSDKQIIDEKAQAGTQKAQASTQAWTKNTLIAAYIL